LRASAPQQPLCSLPFVAVELVQDFVAFLNKAITPFHAVEEAKRQLLAAG
jgi:hypothetical protein